MATLRLLTFSRGKGPRCPQKRNLGGPETGFDVLKKTKISCPSRGLNHEFFSPSSTYHGDWVISTVLVFTGGSGRAFTPATPIPVAAHCWDNGFESRRTTAVGVVCCAVKTNEGTRTIKTKQQIGITYKEKEKELERGRQSLSSLSGGPGSVSGTIHARFLASQVPLVLSFLRVFRLFLSALFHQCSMLIHSSIYYRRCIN